MKLLTHNMLACHIKGVKENQPFIIEVHSGRGPVQALRCSRLALELVPVSLCAARASYACARGAKCSLMLSQFFIVLQATETREVDADYNPDFLRHIYPRIEWPTLRTAAATLGAPRCRCEKLTACCCHPAHSALARTREAVSLACAVSARHAVMETRATFGSKTMSTPPIMEFAPFLCAASGLDAGELALSSQGSLALSAGPSPHLSSCWLTLTSVQLPDTDAGDLPEEVQPEMLEDDEFLRRFHHALLEVRALHSLCAGAPVSRVPGMTTTRNARRANECPSTLVA